MESTFHDIGLTKLDVCVVLMCRPGLGGALMFSCFLKLMNSSEADERAATDGEREFGKERAIESESFEFHLSEAKNTQLLMQVQLKKPHAR